MILHPIYAYIFAASGARFIKAMIMFISNLLINPYEGLNPAIPQYAAGRRVEPPVSVDNALFQIN